MPSPIQFADTWSAIWSNDLSMLER